MVRNNLFCYIYTYYNFTNLCSNGEIQMIKPQEKIRRKYTCFWNRKRKGILKKGCQMFDNWKDILKYLKDNGIVTTKDSARSVASRNKYPRPLIKRGGKRDHSHEEPQLFKLHSSSQYLSIKKGRAY